VFNRKILIELGLKDLVYNQSLGPILQIYNLLIFGNLTSATPIEFEKHQIERDIGADFAVVKVSSACYEYLF